MSKERKVLLITSIFTLLAVMFTINANAQRISTEQYIDQWDEVAVQQMHDHGIPASITLAQGILESGSGNSELSRRSNNHFGIKCGGDWKGKSVRYDDDRRRECFRKYANASQSFHDHSEFLKRQRYAHLFQLRTSDYKGWAKGLKKAGYATDPKYPHKLIDLIEKYDLARYDKMPPGPLPKPEAPVVASKEPQRVYTAKRNDEVVVDLGTRNHHQVSKHPNNIKYITVKQGDTYYSIAEEFEMALWQIYKYNDLSEHETIHPGDVIFLQPKRGSAKADSHTVANGETLHDISQHYGIKLKRLCKYNGITPGYIPKAGDRLLLKKA